MPPDFLNDIFTITVPTFTVSLTALALILWSLTFARELPSLRHRLPLSVGVRSAALVTVYGMLLSLLATSLSNLWFGIGDMTNTFAATTRAIAIVGGVYALMGTFVRKEP